MPYKIVYNNCIECGKSKGSTPKKLCRSCAAKKWWAVGDRRENKRKAMNEFWADSQNREAAARHSKRIWSNEERRRRQRQVQTERWADLELREQKRQKMLELWRDPKYRKRMETIYQSDECRNKISEAVTAHWQDPDIRGAHLETMRSDEYREKQSALMTKRYEDQEARKKTSEASKKAWESQEMRAKWLSSRTNKWSTDWLEDYPEEFDVDLKEKIRYLDSYRCALCEISQEDLERKLFVHHIDYDKNNCTPDNLVSLCNSCHSKTNWNRPYWETIFEFLYRPWRRVSCNL